MRLNVTQTEWMIGNVAKRFRLRFAIGHEIWVIRMPRNIATGVRMAWDGADRAGRGFSELGVSEFRVIRMTRIVAQQHRMARNTTCGQIVIRLLVIFEIGIVRMFGDIALVGRMGRHIANSILKWPSQSRIAILWIVRMTDEIAQDARMSGQVDVADGLDFGWRATGSVFRIIRMLW